MRKRYACSFVVDLDKIEFEPSLTVKLPLPEHSPLSAGLISNVFSGQKGRSRSLKQALSDINSFALSCWRCEI